MLHYSLVAEWLTSNIDAYESLKPSILNFIAAALLAAVLHLVIVLFIFRIDRKHRNRFSYSSRPYSHVNAVLVVFSAAFLALTVLSGSRGDYEGYLHEWMAVLGGYDPWESDARVGTWVNAYGPLFNMLALLVWVNPLAN